VLPSHFHFLVAIGGGAGAAGLIILVAVVVALVCFRRYDIVKVIKILK